MDLVYTVSKGSNCDDLELRFSIRSMVKHLAGIDRIVIVGHCPAFLQGVLHIPAEDPHQQNRAKNIYEKIMRACLHAEVSQRFICASDDHFLLKGYEAKSLPYFRCGTLQDYYNKLGKDNYYKLHLGATIKALEEAGRPTTNFNIHAPIRYNKQLFIAAMTGYDWSVPKAYVSKSLYCNTLKIEGEFLEDNKIHQPFTKTAIYRRLKDKAMFSTNEHSVNEPMKEVLQELYPEPSHWEINHTKPH